MLCSLVSFYSDVDIYIFILFIIRIVFCISSGKFPGLISKLVGLSTKVSDPIPLALATRISSAPKDGAVCTTPSHLR